MNVRALPPLQGLCDRHEHVVLLWDERIQGRSLLGIGKKRRLLVESSRPGDWNAWNAFIDETQKQSSWAFGWLGYDLHESLGLLDDNQRHQTIPGHPGGWPLMCWWEPEIVVEWASGAADPQIVAGITHPWAVDIMQLLTSSDDERKSSSTEAEGDWAPLEACWTQEAYHAKFNEVHRALQRGDIYEMNLCMPWTGKAPAYASWSIFERLASHTKAPYSAYVQAGPWRTICASPERYLAKRGNTLHSHPIKGTVKRGKTKEEDQALQQALASSEKERAENVMIVDLVRNDLSRIAAPNSVTVDELYGIHTFSTVHQMISSISCTLTENVSPLEIMRATFPMGSMTGAPKLSAMRYIAALEESGRGIYSGTIGYVSPDGDWDLNVVIRSLMHRADTGRVDATFGGAITLLANAENEYQECLLKAEALRECMAR